MVSFQERVTKLEQRHRPRHGLSSERRKHLSDLAVRDGDVGALEELNRHRAPITHASADQRAAAVAAGLRADL